MGTHPIFESDFDCLTEIAWALSDQHMTIFRLSGSTSHIPNNLIFYKEENENVAVVATKGGVLIGQNQKIKIESEIISLIKLPKYRLAIVSAKNVFLYQLTRPINQNTASHIDTWDAPNDDRITAGGGIDSSEDIFIALSSLNICRISCGTFSFSLQTKVQGQHLSEIVSLSIGETQSMSTCDQDGLIQFWNISSSIPTPLWTYSDGVNIPICSSVNRDYVIIGTMLGKLLVIKNGEQVSEITAHRASVSSISIKHDEKVDPNVACSVAEDGTYLTFTTSGIKFKHGLIENAMFSGVQWIDHDQIGLSAYGRDYVITEKIG